MITDEQIEAAATVLFHNWPRERASLGDLRQLAKQALEAAEQPAWQPIETAPKDGKSVIVGCDYDRLGKMATAMAFWESRCPSKRHKWVEAAWYDEVEGDWDFAQIEFRPTHWRHLPELPRQKEQKP